MRKLWIIFISIVSGVVFGIALIFVSRATGYNTFVIFTIFWIGFFLGGISAFIYTTRKNS